MLIGEYIHTLDDKKRVSLPAKFRSVLGKKIVLSRGLDNCVFIYSQSEWKSFVTKLSTLSMGQSDSRAFSRFMLGGAVETDVDASGRILVPDFLKDFARLESRIVMAGVGNRVEVWNEESWKTYTRELESRADVLAQTLGDVGMV